MEKEAIVAVSRCDTYDSDKIYRLLKKQFCELGISVDKISGKRVVIKPNLVRKMDSRMAGTTHPSFIEAVGLLLWEMGARSVTVGESPGGPYNESALRSVYGVCGIDEAAKAANVGLNLEISWKRREYLSGVVAKSFNIIDPFNDCDLIINICKLKSHGMTMMSAAVKNYFGTIPGVEKFEMHARFPNMSDFCGMLVDLCAMHTKSCPCVNIVDAVVGMEGNGPTNGTPKKIGVILASENPFALDHICAELIGFENRVETDKIAMERALFDPEKIKLAGENLKELRVDNFKAPDSEKVPLLIWLSGFMGGRLMRLFEPRPKIDPKKCRKCGECVRSCPKHTISFEKRSGIPSIDYDKCIKCFCCQELCPHDAVKIRQNAIVRLIH